MHSCSCWKKKEKSSASVCFLRGNCRLLRSLFSFLISWKHKRQLGTSNASIFERIRSSSDARVVEKWHVTRLSNDSSMSIYLHSFPTSLFATLFWRQQWNWQNHSRHRVELPLSTSALWFDNSSLPYFLHRHTFHRYSSHRRQKTQVICSFFSQLSKIYSWDSTAATGSGEVLLITRSRKSSFALISPGQKRAREGGGRIGLQLTLAATILLIKRSTTCSTDA